MDKILYRYIKKYILLNILNVLIILISLSGMIRLLDEFRNLEKKNYSIFNVFFYTCLSLPKDFELFFPVSVLLGGLLGLGILEVRNELVIMQVFGLSKFQISASVVKASVWVLLCGFIFNEWLLPHTQQLTVTDQSKVHFNTYLFPGKNKNLWLINNNGFVSIEHMLTNKELLGVNFFYFNKEKKIKNITYVERIIYSNKVWTCFNIIEFKFFEKIQPISKRKNYEIWNTELTPTILSKIIIHPRMLSIFDVMNCMKYFNKVGQNYVYYQFIFWNKIFFPIIGLIMILIALSCSFGPLYHKKISVRLMFGSIIGFLFYILYQVFGFLSVACNISPLIGSITPIMLLLTINIIICWKYF